MKIQVTQEDIDKGKHGSTCECPVAIAIKRVAEHKEINVFPRSVYYGKLPSGVRIPLPLKVQTFIQDFDYDEKVEPFEFEIKLP